jgi:hypothetical protein
MCITVNFNSQTRLLTITSAILCYACIAVDHHRGRVLSSLRSTNSHIYVLVLYMNCCLSPYVYMFFCRITEVVMMVQ